MKANPRMKIEIGGHTDSSGTGDHNKMLSEKRAQAVYMYLATHGINKNRIVTNGYGYSKPMSSFSNEKNRRVEITILSAQ